MMTVVFGVDVDLMLLSLDDGLVGTKVLDGCGLLTVQGQSVMVKVVDLVTVYVLVPIVNVVGLGQTVVRMSVVYVVHVVCSVSVGLTGFEVGPVPRGTDAVLVITEEALLETLDEAGTEGT
jgi:hypothetical protein